MVIDIQVWVEPVIAREGVPFAPRQMYAVKEQVTPGGRPTVRVPDSKYWPACFSRRLAEQAARERVRALRDLIAQIAEDISMTDNLQPIPMPAIPWPRRCVKCGERKAQELLCDQCFREMLFSLMIPTEMVYGAASTDWSTRATPTPMADLQRIRLQHYLDRSDSASS